jgi:protein O-mannosyl-transferase
VGKASGKNRKAFGKIASGPGGKEVSHNARDSRLPQEPRTRRTQHYIYYLAAAVALITFAVYLETLKNGFVNWDDVDYVLLNNHIRSINLSFLKWAFLSFYAWNWHPLTWISHALDYAMWGLNPLGHHLTNNIFHSVNTFIVVVLATRLVEARTKVVAGGDRLSGHLREGKILVAGATTGILFGLHPLHVESVAWIAERKDLLCALFFLLSILSYIKYVNYRDQAVSEGRTNLFFSDRRYLYTIGFFVLALLSKPMAVSLPLVLLILDWYPFRRIRSLKARDIVVEKLPFIALALISSILTILAQKAFGSAGNPPLSVRVFVAFGSLVSYLWKMIMPLNLLPFYPLPRHETYSPSGYFLAVVLVIGISAACLAASRRGRRIWLAAWFYYIITFLPVLGIVQVGSQSMANRYTYLPSLSPFLIMGLGAAWVYEKTNSLEHRRRSVGILSIAAAVLVLVSLSYLTARQIGIWKNSITLWNYQIENEPEPVSFAYEIRGSAFYWQKGQFDKAIADFTRAIALDQSDSQAYFLRAMAYDKKGDIDKAIADRTKAIALNPSFYEAYIQQSLAYEEKGQIKMAIENLEKAISLNSSSIDTQIRLGVLYGRVGVFEKAIIHFNRAVELNPQYHLSYDDRGYTYFLSGQYDKALADFNKAIELDKDDANVYLNRGNLYLKTGSSELAMSDFQKACDLKNESGCDALTNLRKAGTNKGR